MQGGQAITRRDLLGWSAAGPALLAGCGPRPDGGDGPVLRRLPDGLTILLRSGWQTVNIGDIAHTPGMLRLVGQFVPEARTILWSNALDRGVEEMLRRNFPRLEIVSGQTGADGSPDNDALGRAFDEAHFMLHGSGPSVVARTHLEAWRRKTGKPYGVFGVTISLDGEAASPKLSPEVQAVLRDASFVFTRETASLRNLEIAGHFGAPTSFAPDATFALRLHNKAAAEAFLQKAGLEPKQYLVVVPRLRYTPVHKIRKVNWSEEKIARRTAVNERHQEEDHAKLREAIVAWVRKTGKKVLLCPEMTYQLDIMEPLLYRPLPADVKPSVVRRTEFWLPDEASSVYLRALAVLSCECHSAIIAAVNDTPCVYVHQPEDGIKGQMWKDIGLSRNYFEIEQVTGQQLAEAVLQLHDYRPSSQVEVHEAVVYARSLQAEAMDIVRRTLAS